MQLRTQVPRQRHSRRSNNYLRTKCWPRLLQLCACLRQTKNNSWSISTYATSLQSWFHHDFPYLSHHFPIENSLKSPSLHPRSHEKAEPWCPEHQWPAHLVDSTVRTGVTGRCQIYAILFGKPMGTWSNHGRIESQNENHWVFLIKLWRDLVMDQNPGTPIFTSWHQNSW